MTDVNPVIAELAPFHGPPRLEAPSFYAAGRIRRQVRPRLRNPGDPRKEGQLLSFTDEPVAEIVQCVRC